MNLHHFQFAIDQKSIVKKAGSIVIEGMASTDRLDRHGDIILPSAYEGTLETYMSNPQILLQHDYDKPIGKCTESGIRENGLWIKAEITENDDGVIDKIEKGLYGAFSVGFFCKAYEYIYDGRVVFTQDGLAEGATWEEFYASDLRRITDVDLVEISVVSVPANPAALFDVSKAVRKALAIETKSLVPKSVAESKALESKETEAIPAAEAQEPKNSEPAAESKPEESANDSESRHDDGQNVSETAENAEEEHSDEGEVQAGEIPAAEASDAEKRVSEAESKAIAEELAKGLVKRSEHEETVKRLESAIAAKDAEIAGLAKEIGEIYGTLADIARVSKEAHKAAAKAEKAFRLLPVNKGLVSL